MSARSNTNTKEKMTILTFFIIFSSKHLEDSKKLPTFASQKQNGAIAQLVEQRTENPCVTGSIPVGTTKDR